MLPSSLIQLPDYIYFHVVEDNIFVFIDKTSQTLCFNYDTLWLLETLSNNGFCMTFSTIITSAQAVFFDETPTNISSILQAQIQELLQLNVLNISH